jgi:hypothetical protein
MRTDLKRQMVEYYKDLITRTTFKPHLSYYNRMTEIMKGNIKDQFPENASETYVYSWRLDRMFETPKEVSEELGLCLSTVYTTLRGEQFNKYEIQYLRECLKTKQ